MSKSTATYILGFIAVFILGMAFGRVMVHAWWIKHHEPYARLHHYGIDLYRSVYSGENYTEELHELLEHVYGMTTPRQSEETD